MATRQLLAARARVRLTATTREQMEVLREQVSDPHVYSAIHQLWMSDALKLEAVRVVQTSPSIRVDLKLSPSSDGGQDDSGLNEDALSDLGRFSDSMRRNAAGFWCSLASSANGTFLLSIGAEA